MIHIIGLLQTLNNCFKDQLFRSVFLVAHLIFVPLIFFLLLNRCIAQRPDQIPALETSIAFFTSAESTITPTKWWLRKTATANPAIARLATSTSAEGQSAIICSDGFTSTLRPDSYAYISLDPPFPNRIRSNASLISDYLGQIEPGEGVLIVDGPICVDGFSWWLIESLDHKLRGWSAEGNNTERWIVPCSNPNVACRKVIHATPTRTPMAVPPNQNNRCTSAQFSIGELAHVGKDSLLILRSKPDIGDIVARAGPMSIVKIIDGPECSAQTVWWKLIVTASGHEGWSAENNLYPCQKDNNCNPE